MFGCYKSVNLWLRCAGKCMEVNEVTGPLGKISDVDNFTDVFL